MWNLVEFGGMNEIDVANKLVCFRIDGMAIFSRLQNQCHHKIDVEPCSIHEWCTLYDTLYKHGCPNFE
jgi:hypothetical protein